MKIVGFNFKKIGAEVLKRPSEELKINTHIDITNISAPKTDFLKGKEQLLSIEFKYTLDYSPNIAQIFFEGIIVSMLEVNQAEKILSAWKDKKIPEEFKVPLFNMIMRKSGVRALQLEEELNLPPHFPFPRVKVSSEKE